ncbi:MAG: PAS domain S-box protein [Abitibacteriaceae bacterium]|nr:PAS domain S-box protein [Abditibacteriaceae bacterium]
MKGKAEQQESERQQDGEPFPAQPTHSSLAAVGSDELLGFMVESIQDYAIFAIDPHGRVMSWNSGAERIFGYSQAEIMGESGDVIFTPEDRAAGEPEKERATAQQEGRALDERWHLRKDGSRFWASGINSPLRDEAGNLRGFVKVARDNTERKIAETEHQKLVAVVEHSPDLIGFASLEGQPLYMNEAGLKLLGLDSVEHLQSTQITDYFFPEEHARIENEILPEMFQAGRWSGEISFRHFKTGQAIPVIWDVFTIRDRETGEPINLATVSRDISSRKQAEAERESSLIREQEARREAEAANRAKDEFLATLSHELRTPLNAILGWSRLLASGHLSATEAEAALKTIDRNAQAQAQLIEDILDVSRIVSGKLRLESRPVDLASVIEAAVDTARPAAEAKQIRLRRVVEASAITVLGDANRLQQVVWNLLSNAIKFTPQGGQVQVQLEREDAQAQIIVTDTGQGISAEFLPHVFDRFRQANSTSTRTHGGLGLGLAIVRHLVELHGGRALVDSPGLGKGSTFTVKLPLAVINQPANAPVDGPERRSNKREKPGFFCPPALADLQVLIVDDEADSRDLLVSVLAQCGAKVQAVSSVAEAMQAVEQSPPDMIVSDIGMPNEDGYSFISKLRALPPERGGRTPAVALTAYARVEDRMRVLGAGFQMHVPKPVEPAELVAVLASLAAWRGKNP